MSIDHTAGGGDATAQVRFGDVVIRRTAVPLRRTMIDGAARHGNDAVRLLVVRSGALTVTLPGRDPVRLDEGEALFTGRGRVYRTDDPGTVLLSSTVPVGELPAVARHPGDLPLAPIGRAPLIDALAEAMGRLIDEPWTGSGADPGYVGAGLINLHCAVLAELRRRDRAAAGPDLLVDRAVAHIERHLDDPALRSPDIAQALGVSLRYLHLAFERRGATVARTVRNRRLDLVAAAIREDPALPLEALVLRSGLPSVATMERAFHLRFGHPIPEHAVGDTISASPGTDRGLPDTSQI